ncbi:hypothetical protein GY45DRAFT_56786 [Cubamyces sp. BRFM 1775]|nr:hypothetical protein GY45DRAFT_56786 [Cubamyces sp. BRFM 1775]
MPRVCAFACVPEGTVLMGAHATQVLIYLSGGQLVSQEVLRAWTQLPRALTVAMTAARRFALRLATPTVGSELALTCHSPSSRALSMSPHPRRIQLRLLIHVTTSLQPTTGALRRVTRLVVETAATLNYSGPCAQWLSGSVYDSNFQERPSSEPWYVL